MGDRIVEIPLTAPAVRGRVPGRSRKAAGGFAAVTAPGAVAAAPRLDIVAGSNVEARPLAWLWDGYLLAGRLNVLAGAPGSGKTTLALAIAAAISQGGAWPDGSVAPRGHVLVWSGGDSVEQVLLPGIAACGGDAQQVFFVGGARSGEAPERFDPQRDAPALLHAARKGGEGKLLVVDGLPAAGADAQALQGSLRALAAVAEASGCAVLAIVDLGVHGRGGDPVRQLIDVAGSARVEMVLCAARRQAAGGEGVFTRLRSRHGPDGGGFAYLLERGEPAGGIAATRALWGRALAGSAQRIMLEADEDPVITGFTDNCAGARAEAMEFLQALLADGPVLAWRVRDAAEAAGHSPRTMARAKGALGAVSVKDDMKGNWYWSMRPKEAFQRPAP